jgi:hypothetical protein
MDHRDDTTLYQTLRDANASARSDIRTRGKRVLRLLRDAGVWSAKAMLKLARGFRKDL